MAPEMILLATGVQVDLNDIIDHPEKYGFKWGYGSLKKKGHGEVSNGPTAPYRVVTPDLYDRYTEVFGKPRVVQWLNGGAKVADQKLREDLVSNLALRKDDRTMKAIVLRKAFGLAPKATQTTVYVEKLVEKRMYVSDDNNFESEDREQVAKYNVMAREAEAKITAGDTEGEDEGEEQDEE